MTEIVIKNFQSVRDIKFPIEGFTVIYGKNNSENQFKLGQLAFEIYAESTIGKIMFSLMGNDLKKAAMVKHPEKKLGYG